MGLTESFESHSFPSEFDSYVSPLISSVSIIVSIGVFESDAYS